MNSILRLILLVDLLCLSTAGLAIFGLPSPRLHSLKNSSSSDDENRIEIEATVEAEAKEDEANAFENIVRRVSKNKECELLKLLCD